MDDPLGHHEALARRQFHGAALQVDEESPLHHIKELVLVVMLVPVILALQDAEPDDGVVHAAERLVVPAVLV